MRLFMSLSEENTESVISTDEKSRPLPEGASARQRHDEHSHRGGNKWIAASVSLIALATGLILDKFVRPEWFTGGTRFLFYVVAYLPVGLPILLKGIKLMFRREIFTEFLLMSIATIGAFYIGEFAEGVAVMLFYAIGELFQDAAVNRAKRNIKALLDVRPDRATVIRKGSYESIDPTEVQIGEVVQVKVGERVPLDGTISSDGSSFNTAALTGESMPSTIEKGELVLAGMINESKTIELEVTKKFNDTSLSRILAMVQTAQGRKAATELFIRKFARIYTPIVVGLALALTFIPYFFVGHYDFEQWLYRALIFLVISCPCALVIAIPLGYFGGIGASSRNGILFKGSSYLDRMTRVDTIVMDKTGTLTKGIFTVQKIVSAELPSTEWLPLVAALESQSIHPVARAISKHVGVLDKNFSISNVEELKGLGMKGIVNGREVLAGNAKLMSGFKIPTENTAHTPGDSVIFVAIDGQYAGYFSIADELKDDAKAAINKLHQQNIRTVMLSGDAQEVVSKIAADLGINEAHGALLPEHKVEKLMSIKKGKKEPTAFVGDGINDAPVLAISDVGIAMGGLGSDAAIETADVVIQTDQPSKIHTAIRIAKATNNILWQNIGFAFGIKALMLALGAWGVASMWGAVFADVGVALLAILNAVRIQRMNFETTS
jgi:Cd2+/Zn2+-exporting ATPase